MLSQRHWWLCIGPTVILYRLIICKDLLPKQRHSHSYGGLGSWVYFKHCEFLYSSDANTWLLLTPKTGHQFCFKWSSWLSSRFLWKVLFSCSVVFGFWGPRCFRLITEMKPSLSSWRFCFTLSSAGMAGCALVHCANTHEATSKTTSTWKGKEGFSGCVFIWE